MKVAIVGSGFAGFGAAVALTENSEAEIQVFDIGLTNPFPNQPDKAVPNAKTHLGTFFSYGVNDNRWSVGLESKRICSSHALGGYSTVYSGSILYPKDNDLQEWPTESRPKPYNYRKVLSHFNVLSADDNLQDEFPVIPTNKSIFKDDHDKCVSFLGFSRIATANDDYEQANKTKLFCTEDYFRELIKNGKISYKPDVFALKIEKSGNKSQLLLENKKGTKELSDEFDAVFLGAGCINTTGIVDRSLFGIGTREYELKSPVAFINAFFRFGFPTDKAHLVRRKANLPEFFLESKCLSPSQTWTHTQITAINEQIISAISAKIFFFRGFIAKIFRNVIYFSITAVHSKFGTSNLVKTVTTESNKGCIKYSTMIEESNQSSYDRQFRSILFKGMRTYWRQLRMIPIPFGSIIADYFRGNKLGGWHYGGTLPMKKNPELTECHPNGEIAGLPKTFVIDSSAFPEIPGSTVALLTSANAHRIANNWIMENQFQKQKNGCQ